MSEGRFNNESSPEPSVEICEASPGPVAHRDECDRVLSSLELDSILFHPVHRFEGGSFGHNIVRSEASHKGGLEGVLYLFDRFGVEVIGVVVADKYHIYFRKLTDLAGRGSESFGLFLHSKDGVDEEAIGPDLEDSRRMADPGVLDFVVLGRSEVRWHHWQLFFYQFVVLLAIWGAFSLGLVGELEGDIV